MRFVSATWPDLSRAAHFAAMEAPDVIVGRCAPVLLPICSSDPVGSDGAYGGRDVGGQECRECGGALLGVANSFGRVRIGGRGSTAVGEQGRAFVE